MPGDFDWMNAAAALAARGRPLSRPNPAVGAVIVAHGRVVGRGHTQPGGRPHAEAMALAMAGDRAAGATLYVTLEPCAHDSARGPACADLVVAAGLARVVIGCLDPDPRTAGAGVARLRAAGIAVTVLDHAAARASLAGYLLRTAAARPHVTLKLATSLDGRIALASGESQWITGPAARAHVHAMRARSDAILVGGGTLRSDAPRLDVRLPGLEGHSPERCVLTRGVAPPGWRAVADIGAPDAFGPAQYLYVEGGAGAAATFLAADRVDRLMIYRAAIVIGSGLAAIGDIGLHDLAQAHDRWQPVATQTLGSDTLSIYDRLR
ncbi:bifunctional diaminohydroxyphosphoribosylaminopyrimidine deaminase/5-amino-6-(5-phosphoribosylamino)uracil reductase RibD [Novosphingobium sp.]|uniref:bifunctional diaminohydroxyphosphoribosylaminopyrimidine deaminase/5-amino-6-(5-phosphoribosylamino)uracil reductase RibD n=1 Tax=Novosphingobium sp. TaxID=1874826 RepID=UPI003342B69A